MTPSMPPQLTLVEAAGAVASTDAEGSGVAPPGRELSVSKETPSLKEEPEPTAATSLPPPGMATTASAAHECSSAAEKSEPSIVLRRTPSSRGAAAGAPPELKKRESKEGAEAPVVAPSL